MSRDSECASFSGILFGLRDNPCFISVECNMTFYLVFHVHFVLKYVLNS